MPLNCGSVGRAADYMSHFVTDSIRNVFALVVNTLFARDRGGNIIPHGIRKSNVNGPGNSGKFEM